MGCSVPKPRTDIGRVGYRLAGPGPSGWGISCMVTSNRALGLMASSPEDAKTRLVKLLREEGYTGRLYRDDTVDITRMYRGDIYIQRRSRMP